MQQVLEELSRGPVENMPEYRFFDLIRSNGAYPISDNEIETIVRGFKLRYDEYAKEFYYEHYDTCRDAASAAMHASMMAYNFPLVRCLSKLNVDITGSDTMFLLKNILSSIESGHGAEKTLTTMFEWIWKRYWYLYTELKLDIVHRALRVGFMPEELSRCYCQRNYMFEHERSLKDTFCRLDPHGSIWSPDGHILLLAYCKCLSEASIGGDDLVTVYTVLKAIDLYDKPAYNAQLVSDALRAITRN